MTRALALALLVLLAAPAGAQLAERPGTSRDHPFDRPWDLSGRSLKAPRLRALHAPAELPGAAPWLLAHDPFLAYALGRDLNLRDFRRRDGAFGETGRLVGVTRPRVVGGGGGGTLPRDDAASCAICHAIPFGEVGHGLTIPKDAGTGRNTPHLYGAGLLELAGERIEASILEACDLDHDGRITPAEGAGRRALVTPAPAAPALDFGACGDVNGDGLVDVEPLVRVTYVDAAGRWIPWATSLATEGVAAWLPEPQVFGHGQADGALTATLRAFFVQAADVHSGLQAFDPLLVDEALGRAAVSPSGRRQFLTVRPRDRGRVLGPAGGSRDDPDRDGIHEELSCGDVDLAEHFLLHVPPPAERPTPRSERGRARFRAAGCDGCHVPDWEVRDRRLFRLEVAPGPDGALQGRLVRSWKETKAGRAPLLQKFLARGIFSDLRRHDLGPEAHETGFDGTVIRRFRTAPLWGVGTTAPYFHDGASLTLEEAIARHGGEAAASRAVVQAMPEEEREELLAFLRSLVLYPITGLPTDVDGDGRVAPRWTVAGRDTDGPERFDPELLAEVPCAIEGPTRGAGGELLVSHACTNVPALYRLDLPARLDRDRDGFPDLRDDCPDRRGYADGCTDPHDFTGD